MPAKPPSTGEVSIDEAKALLGVTTRQGVQDLIRRGRLVGARKLNPRNANSPWLIPVESIEALLKERAEADTA